MFERHCASIGVGVAVKGVSAFVSEGVSNRTFMVIFWKES